MTTASTIDECTKALLKAGAMQVNVLTLARKI
jgi:predicted amidophosphoribosyltransferase